MMLPFTGLLGKILDGTKTMTTRLDAKSWYWSRLVTHLNRGTRPVLDIWWKNPRNQHPDCYKIGRVRCIGVWRKRGNQFTTGGAKLDGFTDVEDYMAALGDLNNMDRLEVLDTMWTQIIWGNELLNPHWIDGPHPRKVA